jgi:hypothetical protein
MARIAEIKRRYRGEWLAIAVTKEANGEAVEGKLLLHSRNRDEVWRKVRLSRKTEVYVSFAGPPLEEGYAAAFPCA